MEAGQRSCRPRSGRTTVQVSGINKTAQSLGSELTFTDAAGRPVVIPKLPGTRTDDGLSSPIVMGLLH